MELQKIPCSLPLEPKCRWLRASGLPSLDVNGTSPKMNCFAAEGGGGATTAAPADQLLGPTHTQTTQQPRGPTSRDAPAHFILQRTVTTQGPTRKINAGPPQHQPQPQQTKCSPPPPHTHAKDAARTSPTAEQTKMTLTHSAKGL